MNLIKLIGKRATHILSIEDWFTLTYIVDAHSIIIYIELKLLYNNSRLRALCYSSDGKKYLLECRREFDNHQSIERYLTYHLQPLKIVNEW